MPQWAGSCWYYLRYLDPRNTEQPWDPAKERYWMPVDLYVGGAEHAVLHLLYARFWHKVLFDRGHVSTAEPFRRLVNQGMILGEMEFTAFRAPDGRWVSAGTPEAEAAEPVRIDADRVEKRGDHFVLADAPEVRLDARSFKMSKSRGNVINPDQIVADYGADALRLYEMFMGPLEATKPWSTKGVEGIFRFLGRVWRMVIQERAADVVLDPAIQDVEPSTDQLRVLHRTIQAVTADLEGMRFNTAISRMMEFVNQLTPQSVRPRRVIEPFVLLLAPFAPHLAEELWAALGHPESLAYDLWPEYDEAMIREAEIELVVQVNGKLRGRLKVPADATDADLERFARGAEHVSGFLKGKTIARVIVVPKKLVNIVVR